MSKRKIIDILHVRLDNPKEQLSEVIQEYLTINPNTQIIIERKVFEKVFANPFPLENEGDFYKFTDNKGSKICVKYCFADFYNVAEFEAPGLKSNYKDHRTEVLLLIYDS